MMINWVGLHVLILGGARQGTSLARYLCAQGALVTLSDAQPAEKMQDAMQSLAGLPITWALGGHPLSLLDHCDVLALSGGVPLTLPVVQEALRRGIPLTNDSQVFMEAVPCRVIGITGSAGKTTTTTLVWRMASTAVKFPRTAWVGGNIGLPLIDRVDEIHPDDLVILELSSFQLEQMTLSTWVAAILNITPNHLDRHGTLEAYAAAKARLLDYQTPADVAVLNREDAGAWALHSQVKGSLITFGLHRPQPGVWGTFVEDGQIRLVTAEGETILMPVALITLRGEHNLLNVLAACAIAHAAGFPAEAMPAGVREFKGVAHRLELVRMHNGAAWYNDSIATAPERTVADIRAFNEPLVLLLGGRDKDLSWNELAEVIHQRVEHVVVFGEAADKILSALGAQQTGRRPYTLTQCSGLQSAVQAAAQVAQPGSVVLLSPGGTSFDEFKDFVERGERFQLWVNQLP